LGEEGLYFLGGDQTKSLQGGDNSQPQRLHPRSDVTPICLVVEKGADSGIWAASNMITGIVNRKEKPLREALK